MPLISLQIIAAATALNLIILFIKRKKDKDRINNIIENVENCLFGIIDDFDLDIRDVRTVLKEDGKNMVEIYIAEDEEDCDYMNSVFLKRYNSFYRYKGIPEEVNGVFVPYSIHPDNRLFGGFGVVVS